MQLTAAQKRTLLRSSFITFLAMTLHNIPEGLGVYLSSLSDMRLGIQLALAIALHNIPEGMAVAIPIYAASNGSWVQGRGSATWWSACF
jgi:ZIP family zinc transporter